MKKIIVAGIVLLPQMLFAGTDCWTIEYSDHFLAVCTGDEKAEPVPLQSSVTTQPTLSQDLQGAGKKADRSSPLVLPTALSVATAMGAQQQSSNPAGSTKQADTPSSRIANTVADVQQSVGKNKDKMPSMYRRPRSILKTAKN